MPPSNIMPIFPTGQYYKISNAQFPTQYADLLFGQPTAPVVGYVNNSGSLNMVWNLNSAGNLWDQFTFTNAAPSAKGANASVDQTIAGAVLHGSSNATIWTLQPAAQNHQYLILAPWDTSTSKLVWSLASGDNEAPITLAPINFTDPHQIWTLEIQTGGNMARGINDLD